MCDCDFIGNRVVGLGGGLASDLGVDLTVERCTFQGNSAGSGGGLAVSSSSATVTDCEFVGNDATFGGGICLLSAFDARFEGTVVSANTARLQGGGVYSTDSHYEVTDCAVEGNASAGDGGAFWLHSSDGVVTRTPIFDNTAAGLAGGLFVDVSPTTVSSSEIAGNGFAIYVVPSGRALVDARLNWWGTSTGPYHPILNPTGLGDEVSDSVLFDPWIVTADAPGGPSLVHSSWGAIKAMHR